MQDTGLSMTQSPRPLTPAQGQPTFVLRASVRRSGRSARTRDGKGGACGDCSSCSADRAPPLSRLRLRHRTKVSRTKRMLSLLDASQMYGSFHLQAVAATCMPKYTYLYYRRCNMCPPASLAELTFFRRSLLHAVSTSPAPFLGIQSSGFLGGQIKGAWGRGRA